MKYPCPCCGYKTFDLPPDGSYTICQVCYWEDDPLQRKNPDHIGGANCISLKQAQKNFLDFGACERDMLKYVRRPSPDEQRDEDWRPFEQAVKEQHATINLENITSPDELQQLFQDRLRFPNFYGRNWDAFWDAITRLVEIPNPLFITGLKHLKEVLPRDATILEETIQEYNRLGISEIKLQ